MDDMRDYLSLLGVLFHGDASERLSRWSATSPEVRQAFLARISRDGYSAFALHRLGEEALPAEFVSEVRQEMQAAMLRALRNEASLKSLYERFEKACIRFIPLKGIDLAYRIYPTPTLRPFGDWDIFFHPEDLNRARKLLLSEGWKELLTQSKDLHHHTSPLTRGPHFLEPHWTFPCCMEASPEIIWENSLAANGSSCRRVLSPEQNVLLSARHAAEDLYRLANPTKLLLDVAYVIVRSGIDWERLRRVSQEMHQPYPGDLLAAFAEFFPQKMLLEMRGDAGKASAFRKAFTMRKVALQATAAEVLMQEDDRFSCKWFRRILRIFWPKNLRQKYHLPEQRASLELITCYCREVSGKCRKFINVLRRRNLHFEEYSRLIKEAEQLTEQDS